MNSVQGNPKYVMAKTVAIVAKTVASPDKAPGTMAKTCTHMNIQDKLCCTSFVRSVVSFVRSIVRLLSVSTPGELKSIQLSTILYPTTTVYLMSPASQKYFSNSQNILEQHDCDIL